MNKKYPKWTESEINFLIENYPSTSAKFCAANLNRGLSCTKSKILKLNLRTNKQGSVGLLNLLNNSCESFYWIGFLLADGSFSTQKGRNVIKLTSSPKDYSHLVKFANFINKPLESVKLYFVKSTFLPDRNESYEITATHKDLVKSICRKFDIKNNKTYNPPNFDLWKDFSKENLVSLFVGFIDGDGTIYHKHNSDNPRIRIKIHSAWFNFLLFFQKVLEEYFDIKSTKPIINRQGYVELNISKEPLLKNLKLFVINNNIPALERKWDIINLNRLNKRFKTNRNLPPL